MVISATDRRSVGQGVKTPPFHGGNTGSNPVRTILSAIAQLVEQLTFNQWVTGSSPVRVIYAGVAELADAPDLGSGA